jgi:hypothetical protein
MYRTLLPFPPATDYPLTVCRQLGQGFVCPLCTSTLVPQWPHLIQFEEPLLAARPHLGQDLFSPLYISNLCPQSHVTQAILISYLLIVAGVLDFVTPIATPHRQGNVDFNSPLLATPGGLAKYFQVVSVHRATKRLTLFHVGPSLIVVPLGAVGATAVLVGPRIFRLQLYGL